MYVLSIGLNGFAAEEILLTLGRTVFSASVELFDLDVSRDPSDPFFKRDDK